MEGLLLAAWIAGCIGNLAFGICYLPQVIKTYRNRTADGLSTMLIALNVVGNVFGAIYLFSTDVVSGAWHYPIFANYIVALILNLVLWSMKRAFRRGTMRSLNVHVHEYPFEVPNMTDGEHVHRTVTIMSRMDSGHDLQKGNGEVVPVYGTDFTKRWGNNFVIWIYTDEIVDRVMESRI